MKEPIEEAVELNLISIIRRIEDRQQVVGGHIALRVLLISQGNAKRLRRLTAIVIGPPRGGS